MSPLLADVIGLAGSAFFIGAFAYANIARSLNKVVFNLANLFGAIFLLVSLSVNFNLAAFVLEAVWGGIAVVGLVTAIRARRSSSTEGRGSGERNTIEATANRTTPAPSPHAEGGR